MLFTKADVEDALRTLVEELADVGTTGTIRVLGGAAVLLQVGREALTEDIDALHPPTRDFANAVKRIGDARNWPSTWLNDAVKMYVSHQDTDAD